MLEHKGGSRSDESRGWGGEQGWGALDIMGLILQVIGSY